MDSDASQSQKTRNKLFLNAYDCESLRQKRSETQVELRRSMRSDAALKHRKLKELKYEWIEMDRLPSQKYFLEDLDDLIQSLQSSDRKANLMGIYGIRKLLSEVVPSQHIPSPAERVIDLGAVRHIIPCLYRDESPQIQYEAAWALTNMSSANHAHIQIMIEQGVLDGLIYMLHSHTSEIQEQAIWAIGNIAADCEVYRDLILRLNVVENLTKILMSTASLSLTRRGTWCICNIFRKKPRPPSEKIIGTLPVIAKACEILKTHSENVSDILWTIATITENPSDLIDKVIDLDILPFVVSCARNNNYNIVLPVIKVIGNCIGGNDSQAEFIIKIGGLGVLKQSLSSPFSAVKRETVWAVSNLCAGTFSQIEKLFNSGIISKIILMTNSETIEIQKEIAWVFSNIVLTESYFIEELLEKGIMRSLIGLLQSKDNRIVMVALVTVQKIFENFYRESAEFEKCMILFEEAQGFGVINSLQGHKHPLISEEITNFLDKYADSVEENNVLQRANVELSYYII